MDDPVPVRRALVGCLAIVVLVGGVMLLLRPLIFTFAPPRDDSAVTVATAQQLASGPVRADVVLSRSYGWDGEIDAGDGRVQLRLLIVPSGVGRVVVLSAASPAEAGCAVEIAGERLVDCDGRTWTLEGAPIDVGYPPLQRFPAEVTDGSVVVDLTRTVAV